MTFGIFRRDTLRDVTKRLVIPPTDSRCSDFGAAYKCNGYEINYAEKLIKAERQYQDFKARTQEGYRMSTAAEELAIQLDLERAGKDPRTSKAFDDLFAYTRIMSRRRPVLQYTITGLRPPKGHNFATYEQDSRGRKFYPMIVLLDNKEVGEVLLPIGSEMNDIVVEWDEVFGIPRITEHITSQPGWSIITPTYFNFEPWGGCDLYITRECQSRYEARRGIRIRAVASDSLNRSFDNFQASCGFRPVRGSLPQIEKIDIPVDRTTETLIAPVHLDFGSDYGSSYGSDYSSYGDVEDLRDGKTFSGTIREDSTGGVSVRGVDNNVTIPKEWTRVTRK